MAEVLGKAFIDSDKVIEERAGANIPWIFDLEGEPGFRERECYAIDELTQQGDLVLATGGGVVKSPENRRWLHERGWVVYLRTRVDTQLERTAKDKNRPLLQQADPRAVLTRLLQEREPYYLETAHLVVDTDDVSPRALADHIAQEFQRYHEDS
ncbi:shikimate kinase [Salinispirillum sp. LH 10-3-1]|uniref:Shikimate kinase n=1 Tax=Salinispirillum sp. LH 10-3-1 TaxID=2952525 RepID=A0AB38YFE8_9GAMM